MKYTGLVIAIVAACNTSIFAVRMVETKGNRIDEVVELLEKMEAQINKDGTSEQASYDKFSCWCEDTLSEKAEEITKAKTKLEELENSIVKNKGFLGGNGADITNLKKDIAENVESQKEANDVRKKETVAYAEERNEAEQCIGALEAAIKVLTGAGTGKKGFLETLQQAQILSVVSGMRGVLKAPVVKHSMSNKDYEIVQHFVENPDDFLGHSDMSAVQVGNKLNPFGDYAPQSTQIQGILKGMYDAFTSDLEKDNVEEAEKQKSFEELMATKKKELKTLESTLQTAEVDEAEKTKSVMDDKEMRDVTKEQLEGHEETFVNAKAACSKKAKQWAQRTRLRTQELAGVKKAIEILTSDEAKGRFAEAETFLQVSSVKVAPKRDKAYKHLKSVASRFQNLKLAQIAIMLKTGGHFDDVIKMIDDMIAVLREEAAEDIAHRDRCEDKENANKNSKADLEHEISKAEALIEQLDEEIKAKEAEIKSIEEDMKKTKATMEEMTELREKETEEFKKKVEDDKKAIEVLEEAKRAISDFYAKEKGQSPMTKLLQSAEKPSTNQTSTANNSHVNLAAAEPKPEAKVKVAAAEPKPETKVKVAAAEPKPETKVKVAAAEPKPVKLVAAEPKPETNWDAEGGNYKGYAGGATGIVAILDLIMEDIEQEIKDARQDEIDAQVDYEKDMSSLTDTLRASEKAKVKAEVEKGEMETKKADTVIYKEDKEKNLKEEEELTKAIAVDCDWVKTYFEKRATARKEEEAALVEAKDFLAGVGTDEDLSLD